MREFPFLMFSRAGRYCRFQGTCNPHTLSFLRGII